jgi:hypothetical protein
MIRLPILDQMQKRSWRVGSNSKAALVSLEGCTSITRRQLDQLVDEFLQSTQQPQASMQPSCETSTVESQTVTCETEAPAFRGDGSLGLSQPGTLRSQAARVDPLFEKSQLESLTNISVEVANQSGAGILSSGLRHDSESVDGTFSHFSDARYYEDSIMTESHAPAPSQPKCLLLDGVTTLFAELAGLILRLPDLAKLPDTRKIRSISEQVQRRIAIFEKAQCEIEKLEDRNSLEASIGEEVQRRILELKDQGLQISNQKPHFESTASTIREENALSALKDSQTSRWESDLSTLLTKVDLEFVNGNVAIPIIAFCYSSLLSCCWSVSGVKFDGFVSETTVIDANSSSHTKEDWKYLWYVLLVLLLPLC